MDYSFLHYFCVFSLFNSYKTQLWTLLHLVLRPDFNSNYMRYSHRPLVKMIWYQIESAFLLIIQPDLWIKSDHHLGVQYIFITQNNQLESDDKKFPQIPWVRSLTKNLSFLVQNISDPLNVRLPAPATCLLPSLEPQRIVCSNAGMALNFWQSTLPTAL